MENVKCPFNKQIEKKIEEFKKNKCYGELIISFRAGEPVFISIKKTEIIEKEEIKNVQIPS